MTKIEFLLKLEKQLAGLPESDLIRTIDYYNEIIDDRTEDTGSEAEAVAALGAPEDVAAQVISEFSLPKLVKEKIKPRRKMAVWEIVLLCVGSPILVCLLIAAFAAAVALYAVAFLYTFIYVLRHLIYHGLRINHLLRTRFYESRQVILALIHHNLPVLICQ